MAKVFHDSCITARGDLHNRLNDLKAASRYFCCMDISEEIGKRIAAARKAKGLKQREVCALIPELEVSRLSNYEKGIRRPDIEVAKKLSSVLGVTASYLMTLDDDDSVYVVSDKKIISAAKSMEKMSEPGKDAATKVITTIAESTSNKDEAQPSRATN